MSKYTRNLLAVSLLTAVAAHLVLLVPLPQSLQGLAALFLTALIPGFLLVDTLVGQSDTPPTTWERTLYSVAAGYAVAILGMLGLSYLPGGLAPWQTFALFDSLIIALALVIVRQDRRAPRSLPDPAIFADADLQLGKQHWLLAGILVLLLTGAFFRFANLGYSEYQGDEARAAERAAAIIQGYDDVLMLHKKGPTEIVLPTVVYSLTGRLTETTSRLPFAIANLAALFAVFLLGWRFFNPLTGWIAAMFFALDGYFIGFARIVQYQSVVFLTSILVVLILYRLVQQPRNFTRYFTLASILLATGLLSHYEAGLVVIPAVFLLGLLLWQNRSLWSQILIGTVIGGAVGVAILAAFYVPFVLHPHFQATYTYLTDRRIGGSFPYNNLADFFLRTTVYSTTYYVGLLIAFTVVALIRAYWRGLGRIWGLVLGALVVSLMVVTFWNPTWLTVGRDRSHRHSLRTLSGPGRFPAQIERGRAYALALVRADHAAGHFFHRETAHPRLHVLHALVVSGGVGRGGIVGWSAEQDGARGGFGSRRQCSAAADHALRQLRLLVLHPQSAGDPAHVGFVASGRLLGRL